jgi:hypothetical protein
MTSSVNAKIESMMSNTNSKSRNSLDLLQESNRQLQEYIDIGCLTKLQQQKEQLGEIQEKSKQTSQELTYSSKLLRGIQSWWKR